MAKNKGTFDPTETVKLLEGASLKKKLSVKTIFGRVTPEFLTGLGKDGAKAIMRVIGQAVGIKTGQTDLGPWISFKGNFLAINLATNEASRGARLFLPDVAGEMVEAALIGAGDGAAVNIAFDISIKRDESSSVGYVYEATPLLPVQEADPLRMLIQETAGAALPPPETK